MPQDISPSEITETERDSFTLRSFFYDYCISPANRDLSRGFLSGLEVLAYRVGYQSNLVKACQAISLGGHGKTLGRTLRVKRAEMIYQELLGSFAEAIGGRTLINIGELIRVAMVLGLYQVSASGH